MTVASLQLISVTLIDPIFLVFNGSRKSKKVPSRVFCFCFFLYRNTWLCLHTAFLILMHGVHPCGLTIVLDGFFHPSFLKYLESYIDYFHVYLLAFFLHCLWHTDTFVDALLLPAVSLWKSGKPMAG